MMPITLGQVCEALDTAQPSDDSLMVQGVSVDTRTLRRGDIFFAIPGERVDPHELISDARTAGAVAAVVERAIPSDSLPHILVPNAQVALGQLAHWYWRERLSCTTIGITGSSGKTTTKDMIAQVLETYGATVSPQGSFNTEVGVPLTILAADDSTRFLVLEMGMRGIGHIAYLTRIATPDIAVVTNVGHAHVGMLGSVDQIAVAKGELIEGLSPEGIAVLNADDPRVVGMSTRTTARALTFGRSIDADVQASDIEVSDTEVLFHVVDHRDGSAANARLRYVGEHNVSNAVAALCVGLSCGMTLDGAVAALSHAQPRSAMRMDVIRTKSGCVVINDAYNANPESMSAALHSLGSMPGRRWAILGEMRELGDASAGLHAGIGQEAAQLGIAHIVCVGSGTRPMHEAALDAGGVSLWLPDVDDVIQVVSAEIRPGDVVLVKASRSIGLERVAQALVESQGGAST